MLKELLGYYFDVLPPIRKIPECLKSRLIGKLRGNGRSDRFWTRLRGLLGSDGIDFEIMITAKSDMSLVWLSPQKPLRGSFCLQFVHNLRRVLIDKSLDRFVDTINWHHIR